MSHASHITHQAKSNLAFALHILPKDRREDAVIFYAYCRVIDDLADDLDDPMSERERALTEWKRGLVEGFEDPDPLQQDVVGLRERLEIPTELLVAVIDGCMMDLQPHRYETWEDLSKYTWKVAGAVGLVSLRIFGAKDPVSEEYAVALGHALQITNILRDVGEDLDNGGRIYLPIAEFEEFDYSEQDLVDRVFDERFVDMMSFQADRAEGYFQRAKELLPKVDKSAMTAAEVMREIYHTLLKKMRGDGFRVFEKRYRLSKARKMAIFSKRLIAG
ncbi:MAG: phytoene/squalene synthase family protein [Verrucomicrobiales bacterium]